jgi:gentisate 1,2-dioxygenase
MAAFLSGSRADSRGQASRSTDAAVYCVVEGRGDDASCGTEPALGPRDVFVTPSWTPCGTSPTTTAILFSLSDRPAQEALGLWREEDPA